MSFFSGEVCKVSFLRIALCWYMMIHDILETEDVICAAAILTTYSCVRPLLSALHLLCSNNISFKFLK